MGNYSKVFFKLISKHHKTIITGKLKVRFDYDYFVYCAIEPRKWCGFHHIANQCKNEPICQKFSGNNKLSDCSSSYVIFIRFNNIKNNVKLDYLTDHAYLTPDCYMLVNIYRNFAKTVYISLSFTKRSFLTKIDKDVVVLNYFTLCLNSIFEKHVQNKVRENLSTLVPWSDNQENQ